MKRRLKMELLTACSDVNFPAKTASYSGTAGTTGTWSAGPQGVLVWGTSDMYVTVGEGVTATTASTPIPAGTPVPLTVPGGTGAPWQVSAIQVSANGVLYAKPMNIR
jgi:hypothetical protein